MRFALIAALWLSAATARANGPYEGAWTASAARREVAIESWGGDCGPRPTSGSTPGGAIRITQSGDHLTIPGPTRRTNACWSDNRAVIRISSTYQGGVWRTVCRTPRDDSRQEEGVYTVRAEGDRLELRDQSSYTWQLNTSTCRANVVTTQTLTRVAGSAPVDAAVATPPPQHQEEPSPSCVPGAPARVRVRPDSLDVHPGAAACFRAAVVDSSGCAVPGSRIEWVGRAADGSAVSVRGGCLTPAAAGAFTVVASSGALRGEARVNATTEDLSGLTAHEGTPGEGTAAPEGAAGSDVSMSGGIAARAERALGMKRGPLLYGIFAAGGALALLLVVMVVVALRRRKPVVPLTMTTGEMLAMAPPADGAPPVAAPEPAPRPTAPTSAPEQPFICPTCRRGFSAADKVCPHDQDTLLPYPEFVARQKAQEQNQPTRICPKCGERYPLAVTFCGKDGSPLSAVN